MGIGHSSKSSFAIIEIDARKRCVIVEDEHFGLQFEVGYGDSELSTARITGPYQVTFFYANGTTKNVQFLT